MPTFIPNAAKVAAGGNGFADHQHPRLLDRPTRASSWASSSGCRTSGWARVGFSWNNAREHFGSRPGIYDTNGNPTPTLSEPLKDGGQFAPQSGGSGSGNVYINAKWQFNANAMYQAPYGIEVSGNVFGRQGYPYPMFRAGTTAALGGDSTLTVLVTPQIDTFRYPNLWNTDLRAARTFKFDKVTDPRHPRLLQRVQREHRAGAEQQRGFADVQRDRAEPQPADLPGRCGGRLLSPAPQTVILDRAIQDSEDRRRRTRRR